MNRVDSMDVVSTKLHDGFLIVSADTGAIQYANETIATWTDFERSSLQTMRLADICDFPITAYAQHQPPHDAHATETQCQLYTRTRHQLPVTLWITPFVLGHGHWWAINVRRNEPQEATDQAFPIGIEVLANAINDFIMAFDLEGHIIFANTFTLHQLGYTAHELVGQHFNSIHTPEHQEEALHRFAEIVAGRLTTCPIPLQRADGTSIPVDAKITRLTLNERTFLLSICRDITERVHTEKLMQAQRDLGIALSVETHLDRALEAVVETALQVSGMDGGGLYLLNPQDGSLHLHYHQGLSEAFARTVSDYPADTPQTRLVRAGKPVFTTYLQLAAILNDELEGHTTPQAIAILPIQHAGQVIGSLQVASFTQEDIPPHVRQTLEAIASQTGSAIARIKAEEALRLNENISRTLLNALQSDIAVLLDRQFNILAINNAGAAVLGSTPAGLVGTNVRHHIAPEITQPRLHRIARVFETGQSVHFEDERQGRYSANSCYPIFDTAGSINQVAIYARDITAQKQYERVLEQQRNLMEAVARATGHLLAGMELDRAIDHALAELGHATDVRRVFVIRNEYDPEIGQIRIHYAYEWVNDRATPALNTPLLQNMTVESLNLQGIYKRLASGHILDDSDAELQQLIPTSTLLQHIQTLLLVPIFAHHLYWGCIGINTAANKDFWHGEERNALRIMAHSLGAAIERHQMEQQLRDERDLANTLREIGTILAGTLDVDTVLIRLLEQIGRIVPYDAANAFLIESDAIRLVHRIVASKSPAILPKIRTTYQIDEFPLLEKIIDEKQALVLADVNQEPQWAHHTDVTYIRSWMAVPIIVQDEVVGLFALDSQSPGKFNLNDIQQLSPVVTQATTALENAHLFAEVQSLEKIKSEMIRIASHDLRNPLARISTIVSRLYDSPVIRKDSDALQLLNLVREALLDIEHISDDILSLERIEAKYRTSHPLHWEELIQVAVKSLTPELEAHQHAFTLDCPANLPPGIGNPDLIYHAVHNLLQNAIKYTPPGGTIQLRAFEKRYGNKPTVAIEVKDSGIGIPPEEQQALFKRRFRASNAQTAHIDGTGRGLIMVKEAIEYHRGRVYYTSHPDHGSLFGFWIPV